MIAVANQVVWSPSAKVALAVVLALWFAVAIALGAAGLLSGELGEPRCGWLQRLPFRLPCFSASTPRSRFSAGLFCRRICDS